MTRPSSPHATSVGPSSSALPMSTSSSFSLRTASSSSVTPSISSHSAPPEPRTTTRDHERHLPGYQERPTQREGHPPPGDEQRDRSRSRSQGQQARNQTSC